MPDRPEPIMIDLVGCARCDGEGHPGLTFRPLTFPLEQEGAEPLTHWASCPTNGEPILLKTTSP